MTAIIIATLVGSHIAHSVWMVAMYRRLNRVEIIADALAEPWRRVPPQDEP